MRFTIAALLEPERVQSLRQQLLAEEEGWQPGARTAGWHARPVKHNRQLDRSHPLHQRLTAEVEQALLSHPLVQAAALPRRLHNLLFSRCGPGEGYGRHVDNAFMVGGRSDLSFTLFLSDPATYTGGSLLLESPAGEEAIRLAAGSVLLYPSSLLHRVEPVQQGERLVAVGWIQSLVRDGQQRELLFDLDTARRSLHQREGGSDLFHLVNRSYTNLLRQWGE